MADLFRRHALILTSSVLIVLSFQLMAASTRDPSLARMGSRVLSSAIFPLKRGYHESSESMKYFWRHYVWLLGVEQERNRLREQIKALEAHNSRLMEHQRENERLRTLLSYQDQSGHRGVPASVVGRDASNWVHAITINRGRGDGLLPGMAVVDGNGIVGQKTTVTEHSARVLLINDASSAVDAILQKSRASGVAEGGVGRDLLRLRYVERQPDLELRVGERVIASGLDGVYPKGTVVGVVENVEARSSGLFNDILVRAVVDFDRLESVLVLIPDSSGPALASVNEEVP